NKFYVDELYGRTIVLPGKAFATFCAGVVDTWVIDGMVTGTGRLVAAFAGGIRKVQTGYVRNYAAIFFFGVVVVFSVLVARVVGA
ncbi:MAG: NADH-quinone oxidoreductase subunit L, partial [Actinomycetota bacterium]